MLTRNAYLNGATTVAAKNEQSHKNVNYGSISVPSRVLPRVGLCHLSHSSLRTFYSKRQASPIALKWRFVCMCVSQAFDLQIFQFPSPLAALNSPEHKELKSKSYLRRWLSNPPA
jgi:hypothetical protein